MALTAKQIRVVIESFNKIFIILKEQNERLKDMDEPQHYVAMFIENGPEGVVMTSHPSISHPSVLIHKCDEIWTFQLPPLDKLNKKQACDMILHVISSISKHLDDDLKQDLYQKFKFNTDET